MLPAVWFIFSRKGYDATVQYMEDCRLLNKCEMNEVELTLKRFHLQYPDAVRESSAKFLLRGVAAHHAGCLPLWKSFIEELFQRGLVKVVFATETLAAGINMPARTAVISSLSKRTESGRSLLTSNELLQMAGRAGRRGIDERGHVVLVQTPYEGAEESCKILFSGLEPLVSQFTASYGMVLNLLGVCSSMVLLFGLVISVSWTLHFMLCRVLKLHNPPNQIIRMSLNQDGHWKKRES